MNHASSIVRIYQEILSRVARRRRQAPFVIGINGIDGSGKTEFSRGLSRFLVDHGCRVQVVHVDDFHNPKSVRYNGFRGSSPRDLCLELTTATLTTPFSSIRRALLILFARCLCAGGQPGSTESEQCGGAVEAALRQFQLRFETPRRRPTHV